jgi:hypothetical protein
MPTITKQRYLHKVVVVKVSLPEKYEPLLNLPQSRGSVIAKIKMIKKAAYYCQIESN